MTIIDTMDIASANISNKIVPINILDADDGLRLNAFIVAIPIAAITNEGPKTTTNMVNKMIIVFIVFYVYLMLDPCNRVHMIYFEQGAQA